MGAREKFGIGGAIVAALILVVESSAAITSGGWEPLLPNAVPLDLTQLVVGNGRLVAVGGKTLYRPNYTGCILWSDDAVTWTAAKVTPSNGFGYGGLSNKGLLAYGNGTFFAVDSNGFSWVSRNGADWNAGPAISDVPIAVHFGNGVFIIPGMKALHTSADGLQWQSHPYPSSFTPYADAPVAFGDGLLIVFANSISSVAVVTRDWTHWTQTVIPAPPLSGSPEMEYANGRFVRMPSDPKRPYLISTDGVKWTEVPFPESMEFEGYLGYAGDSEYRFLHSVDGRFWLESYDSIEGKFVVRTSTDGLTWQILTRSARAFNAVIRTPGRYVAVGPYGGRSSSSDGVTWVSSKITDSDITGLFCLAGLWFAIDVKGRTFTSNDGDHWVDRGRILPRAAHRDMAYGKGIYVAVGSGDDSLSCSFDGKVWGAAHSASAGAEGPWYGVAFGNGRFVACSFTGHVAYSNDGQAWNLAVPPWTKGFSAIAFGDGKFICAGNDGRVVVSTDGESWTAVQTGVTDIAASSVAYGGNMFCIGASNGNGLVSFDSGKTWKQGYMPGGGINDAIWAKDRFVAVGFGGYTASTTGGNWSPITPVFDVRLYGVATDGSQVLAAGSGGVILRAATGRALLTAGPSSVAAAAGSLVTLSADTSEATSATWQWSKNGSLLASQSTPVLPIGNVQPQDAGLYSATVTTGIAAGTSDPAIVGLVTLVKVTGSAAEIASNIYVEANRNTYDQVLLKGAAASVTADYVDNQVTRISHIDIDHDIVQVELSGPGTLTVVLDNATGPAPPTRYNQTVEYMKGHAGLVITGATENTNLTIFTVGRKTAVNPALFRDDAYYDGMADLAYVAIKSADGKFGGIRAANAEFYAGAGVTGIYAPGVEFKGPVYLGNVSAFVDAVPHITLGSCADVRITGGDLFQANGQSVQVSGLTRLVFTPGTDSHGRAIPAKANRGTLRHDGRDVTAEIVVNP